jgi:2-polyprenyl-3-methyl-5-hydroxy-6-metoxy-1,4-benzoquinol methylase
MDELLPPRLRDSRWFMYPFFHIWFKGKNIDTYMDFKDIAYNLSEEEFTSVYKNLDCRASDRPTDLNAESINYMIRSLDPTAQTLLDVGCGRGHWLETVATHTNLRLTGCDVKTPGRSQRINYVSGSIAALPFADNAFDIVTCHHTIEHLRDLPTALAELKRVARKQLIIATPCQRCYFYTLDLHLQFFPIASTLTNAIGMKHHVCKWVHGDWVYIGDCATEKAENSQRVQLRQVDERIPASA